MADADLHLGHPGDLGADPDRLPGADRGAVRPGCPIDSFGSHVFDPANGGAILYQHLFWFFGHPEVYIIALPFFGIISEVIPVFSRKPLFGYRGMVYALLGIAALSVAVWAHHMFATGAVLLPFFSFMTFLIAIPTGLKFFNWIGTMWKGQVSFETPMLFAAGFLVTFLFGGLTGVILAAPALDFHVSDSYFVVAHFHYVLFGTIVFATYAGIYFWFPKMTGRFLDERLGRLHFWATFIGFHLTFLVQHWLGNIGMPRRYPDYLPTDGFTFLNTISTIGAFVLGASTLPFIWNVIRSWRYGEITTADDPWGYGNSLEWATSSPPPRHNFTSLPRIRSERPAFELHHPYMVERMRSEAHPARGWTALDEAEASSHLKTGGSLIGAVREHLQGRLGPACPVPMSTVTGMSARLCSSSTAPCGLSNRWISTGGAGTSSTRQVPVPISGHSRTAPMSCWNQRSRESGSRCCART